MKKIIAYKQGQNWIVNINGNIQQLHYTIKTKQDVKNWLVTEQEDHSYEDYEIVFA